MVERSALEAALAVADAEWQAAQAAMQLLRDERDQIVAAWEKILQDRRQSKIDRRKAAAAHDPYLPERRQEGSDRRSAESAVERLSTRVADQHVAYLRKTRAEGDYEIAKKCLEQATSARKAAVLALARLDAAFEKEMAIPAYNRARIAVTSLRKALIG